MDAPTLEEALNVVRGNGYIPIKVHAGVIPGDQIALGDWYKVSIVHDDQIITSRQFVSDWTIRYAVDPTLPGRAAQTDAWIEAMKLLGKRLGVLS